MTITIKGNPRRAETEWFHLGRPALVIVRGSLECHVEKEPETKPREKNVMID